MAWLLELKRCPLDVSRLPRKGHGAFCPWRGVSVRNDPKWCSDQELLEGVKRRRTSLQQMSCVPVVLESSREAPEALFSLATAGWERFGSYEGRDYLRCAFCLRTHVVQAFVYMQGEERMEPLASLWTPEVRQGEAKQAFDAYAMHHYYCPLFCHPEELQGLHGS